MKKKMGLLRKGVELLILGAAAGILIAGCGGGGGGGGTTSANSSKPAVASYIADGQGTSFNGWWVNQGGLLGVSAVATTYSLNTTATAGTYAWVSTAKSVAAASGVWTSSAGYVPTGFDLTPAGWVTVTGTNTFVDGGDGIHVSLNNADGSTTTYSISQTSLSGKAVVCTNNVGTTIACVAPGNYPAGSSAYVKTQTANTYSIPNTSIVANRITDATGAALTALPTIGTGTFCDPVSGYVYQPTTTVGTYNTYTDFAFGCNSVGIASAVAAASAGTVQLASKPTGNAVVPTVLAFSSWTGVALATRFNSPYYTYFLTLNAGNVYWGASTLTGNQAPPEKNKGTINAELVANGLPVIP